MERTFLYTLTTFKSDETPINKFAICLERRKKTQVYVIYRLTNEGEWVRNDEHDWVDYNSARLTLEELVAKDLNLNTWPFAEPTLVLYVANRCPYCFKVLKFMREKGIKAFKKNISKPKSGYKEELIRLGGKKQVPALSIDGKILYESEDIIKWLKEYYHVSS